VLDSQNSRPHRLARFFLSGLAGFFALHSSWPASIFVEAVDSERAFSYWIRVARPFLLDVGVLMRTIGKPVRPWRPSKRPRWLERPAPPKPTAKVHALDASGRARVEECITLAYRLAWHYARNSRDVPPDELIAEALYGLTYASGLFDESRGVPFPAYATLVVRHRLFHAILSWRRAKRAVPYPTRIEVGDEGPWEAEDHRPGPDQAAQASAREMCDRVRQVLPPDWYAVLRLYHVEGYTFDEIGRHFGLTRQRIQQVLIKAIARARRHFPDGVGMPTIHPPISEA
jgi:RNA polymerase sigma factor (sigma-70 family)